MDTSTPDPPASDRLTVTGAPSGDSSEDAATALLSLPWHLPLEQWPDRVLAALPRGISRHVVRFAHMGAGVVAVKETTEDLAFREYRLLRRLEHRPAPSVVPVAVVTGRTDVDGAPLPAALVTRHLRFSLPYRAVFSERLEQGTLVPLMDALATLLVELHLEGFFWGDVSLSNVLFRRDAGAFAAHLVDAETGELRERLSTGQREHDLDVARVNVGGELMDLQASGLADPGIDPFTTPDLFVEAYRERWRLLTEPTMFARTEPWHLDRRFRLLNELGFEVEEYSLRAADVPGMMLAQPTDVAAGYHRRRLERLTGLHVQENQARRLLVDIETMRREWDPFMELEHAAHRWVLEVFDPVVRAVPLELRAKLEPAEVMHQLLEHRWYLSEQRGAAVPLDEAVSSYVDTVLRARRDEDALALHPTTTMLRAVPSSEQG
ncbi:DUF4032 domain-containing protein [Micrococcus sp.]|uniref:DUF4032 domain-containing protein n=1 Tax=Micrococcus sp. TaxID=1271 RepID=UPI002A90E621|nr:DUF4032 domain-containing protein [Micrococcus sp.]MDY6055773.1 DUF4032 domain-containing protein [Micrococcus sp.]